MNKDYQFKSTKEVANMCISSLPQVDESRIRNYVNKIYLDSVIYLKNFSGCEEISPEETQTALQTAYKQAIATLSHATFGKSKAE